MNSKSFMKLAMEEIENEEISAIVAQDNESETGDDSDVDQEFHDVTKAEDDIIQDVEELNNALCDIDDAEDICNFTEEASEQGGLDSTTVELLDVASESLYERLGVRPAIKCYATEDFGSKDAKIKSTRLSLETFKEFISNMWEAIKAAFKRMGMYLKHYITVVFGLNARNIKQATSLKQVIKSKPITAENKALQSDKSPVVIMPAATVYLFSSTTGNDLESFFIDILKSTKTITQSAQIVGVFTSYLGTLSNLKELIKDEKSFEDLSYPKLASEFSSVNASEYKTATGKDGQDLELFKSSDMIGGKAIYLCLPKGYATMKGKEVVEGLGKTMIVLGNSKKAAVESEEDKEKYTVKALSPVSHEKVLTNVVLVSESVTKGQNSMIDIVKRHDDMISQISAVEQILGESESSYKEYRARVSQIRKFATDVNKLSGQITQVVVGTLVKSCHVTLMFTEKSYKTYLKYQ